MQSVQLWAAVQIHLVLSDSDRNHQALPSEAKSVTMKQQQKPQPCPSDTRQGKNILSSRLLLAPQSFASLESREVRVEAVGLNFFDLVHVLGALPSQVAGCSCFTGQGQGQG